MNSFENSAPFGQIYILADGRHLVELKFRAITGNFTTVCVGFEDFLDHRKLTNVLRSKGYGGAIPKRHLLPELGEALLLYAASSEGEKQTFHLTSRGGWSDDLTSFRLGNLELPSRRRLPTLPGLESECWSQKGTLEGWQRGVAVPALYCSTMVLAISACFVAPMLRITGAEAGGFGINVLGKPGTGKSTTLRVAVSTLSNSYAATGDATVQGLQEITQEHCDLPTVIDSLESVPTDRRAAMTDMLAHILTNGIPRLRNRAWAAEHRINSSRFRAVVLMSEEGTSRPRSRQGGAAVRLIDVPVSPAEGDTNGVVDFIPTRIPPDRKRAFAKHIIGRVQSGASNHYGHAMPFFIQKLIHHPADARTRFETYERSFGIDPVFANLDGNQERILKRFAQCYAAGRLASDMKVVPWSQHHGRFREAITHCALAALSRLTSTTEQAERDARRILDWLNDPARLWVANHEGLTRREAITSDFVRSSKPAHALVRGETLGRALSMSPGQITAAAKALSTTARLLVEGRSDALTCLRRFRDGAARFYVVKI